MINPEFIKAERTQSLLSFTAPSGKPTIENTGNPPEICTSIVNIGASSPVEARVNTLPADSYDLQLLKAPSGLNGDFVAS